MTTYEHIARVLTPEAGELFEEMVQAHLAATGDRMFLQMDSMQGTLLTFTGQPRRNWDKVDRGALDDLVSCGLLRRNYSSRGTPNYRVSGESLAFHRWWMEQRGSAVEQVDAEVQRLVLSDRYASNHPGAAHHLREALQLLWTGQTDDQNVSVAGDHLRKALMDAVGDLVGPGSGSSEKPIERLKQHLAGDSALGARETHALEQLIDLAAAVLRLDQRVGHIRDESDKDRPLRGWDELRRATFLTVLTCYEIDCIAGG